MTLVALPCAVVSYSTCELVTRVTLTPGTGTRWGGESVILYITFIVAQLSHKKGRVRVRVIGLTYVGKGYCDVLYNVMCSRFKYMYRYSLHVPEPFLTSATEEPLEELCECYVPLYAYTYTYCNHHIQLA